MNKKTIELLEEVLDKNKHILNFNFRPNVFAELLKKEFEALLIDPTRNKEKTRENLINDINDNYFQNELLKINYLEAAYKLSPELAYNNNLEYTKLFSTANAAFNLSVNFEFSNNMNKIDTPTMISYFGLTRFFYSYRAMESLKKFFYALENKSQDLESKEIKNQIYFDKETSILMKDFILEIKNNVETWSKILKVNEELHPQKGISTFDKLNEITKNKRPIDNPMALINTLRNSFSHSNISASTGTSNPLVMFTLTMLISDLILITINNFFKNEVLNKKFDYKL